MEKLEKKKVFIEGPIFIRILLFVLPIIATGVLQVAYNMADNIVVGKFAYDGDIALGAVGSTSAYTNLITNFVIGVSSGASVVIAQFYGARRYDEVNKSVHTAMTLSVVTGLLLMSLGLACAYPSLTLMGTKAKFMESALIYVIIICIGIPASSIYNFGASILRAMGDSKTSLIVLALSGLLNVLLNLFFVIVCGMSVAGVALATIISQYTSAAAVVFVLMRRRSECYCLSLRSLRIEKRLVSRMLRFGLPVAFQSSLFSLSNIIITSSMNTLDGFYAKTHYAHLGEGGEGIVVQAKAIAFSIEGITYTAMHSFTHAATTFIGQNYGAKKFNRINVGFLCLVFQVFAVGLLLSHAEILLTEPLSYLYMNKDTTAYPAEVVNSVREIFDIMLRFYVLCGVMETISGILRGLGYSMISMIASVIGLGIRVVWVLFIHPLDRFNSIFGLFVSYPISWIITILLLLACCVYAWRKIGIRIFRKNDA